MNKYNPLTSDIQSSIIQIYNSWTSGRTTGCFNNPEPWNFAHFDWMKDFEIVDLSHQTFPPEKKGPVILRIRKGSIHSSDSYCKSGDKYIQIPPPIAPPIKGVCRRCPVSKNEELHTSSDSVHTKVVWVGMQSVVTYLEMIPTPILLLMEEILHQLIGSYGSLSHYL